MNFFLHCQQGAQIFGDLTKWSEWPNIIGLKSEKKCPKNSDNKRCVAKNYIYFEIRINQNYGSDSNNDDTNIIEEQITILISSLIKASIHFSSERQRLFCISPELSPYGQLPDFSTATSDPAAFDAHFVSSLARRHILVVIRQFWFWAVRQLSPPWSGTGFPLSPHSYDQWARR